MAAGSPSRSRSAWQWQIVLVDPQLLRAAQRRYGVSGPSQAIDAVLQEVLAREKPGSVRVRRAAALH